ncbi:MAG: hypothetical protein K8F27_07480, partial [Sulfuricellaceae bacterium]|nr:hypothetical protein [Sulfuricellaceae bacterium]
NKERAVAKKPVKSLVQLLKDLLLFGLTLFGIGGVIFKFIMPEGWLAAFIDHVWNENPGYTLGIVALLALIFIPAKNWFDNLSFKDSLGNLITYAWVLTGLYFAVRLFMTGAI